MSKAGQTGKKGRGVCDKRMHDVSPSAAPVRKQTCCTWNTKLQKYTGE